MVPVVIAAVEPDSIAGRALAAEGVQYVEHVCEGPTGYADLLATLWRRGGFVLVEHDIVPWVGAIAEIQQCYGDWCAFRYARSGSTVRSLGFVRFSDRFVTTHPELPARWADSPWQQLDGRVLGAVSEIATVCKHGPPVGHVRRPD